MDFATIICAALVNKETVFVFYRNEELSPVGTLQVLKNRLDDGSPAHPSLLPETALTMPAIPQLRRSSLVLRRSAGGIELIGSEFSTRGRRSLGPSYAPLTMVNGHLQGVTDARDLVRELNEFATELLADAQEQSRRRKLQDDQFPWKRGLLPATRRRQAQLPRTT